MADAQERIGLHTLNPALAVLRDGIRTSWTTFPSFPISTKRCP